MDRSVLIIQPGFLGDAVLATGLLRALQEIDGVGKVGLLVRSSYVSLFNDHPGVGRVHGLEKGNRESWKRVLEEVGACGYDLALIPHRSVRSQLLPYRAGIPERIGFRQSAFSFLCTTQVEYRISDHELERNHALLRASQFQVADQVPRTWLHPDPDLVGKFRTQFSGEIPLIVIAPGSVWPTKCWPEEYFADLCRHLLTAGNRLLLVGSEGERELCRRIGEKGGLPSGNVLAGDLSLPELAALLSLAERVVTNDSAPLHIAEGVGRPVSSIFGPTVPEFGFAPYLSASTISQIELACRPCGIHGHRTCPIGTHECMRSIEVEDLLATITIAEKNVE